VRHRAKILVVDPPWKYHNRHAVRQDGKKARAGIGVADRYSMGVMTKEALEGMAPLVQTLAASNAYLFMWSTLNHAEQAMSLMKTWGFTYVGSAFVWVKTSLNGEDFFGLGRYIPSNIEVCFMGRRDDLWHPKTGWKPRQVIREPHPRNEAGKIIHSRKPETLQDRISRWLSPYMQEGDLRVELFATRQKPDWVCMGHELSGKDLRQEILEACL
jgi:N6-adenosine-specific RNA methylase IME4